MLATYAREFLLGGFSWRLPDTARPPSLATRICGFSESRTTQTRWRPVCATESWILWLSGCSCVTIFCSLGIGWASIRAHDPPSSGQPCPHLCRLGPMADGWAVSSPTEVEGCSCHKGSECRQALDSDAGERIRNPDLLPDARSVPSSLNGDNESSTVGS